MFIWELFTLRMYSPNIYTCTIQAQFFILCIIYKVWNLFLTTSLTFCGLWIFHCFYQQNQEVCVQTVYVICASLYMYMICACMDYMHSEVHPMCLALCNKLSFENKNDNKFKDKIFIYLLFIEKFHEVFFILNARMVIKSWSIAQMIHFKNHLLILLIIRKRISLCRDNI